MTEAERIAQSIEVWTGGHPAAALLRSQAAEIFALKSEVINKAEYARSMYLMHEEAKAEIERLKATSKPNCSECTTWVKEQADNKEWIEGVKRGREICEQLVNRGN